MKLKKINMQDAFAQWEYTASQKVMLKNGARIAKEDETHYFMRIPK